MNRNRKPLDSHNRKKMNKEVHSGQKNLITEDLPRTDTLKPKDAIKKYPAKRQKVEKPLMEATVKGMLTKKKKASSHHSKRTTPGPEIEHRESPPQSTNTDANRIKQKANLQGKVKQKALNTKLQRQNGKKK